MKEKGSGWMMPMAASIMAMGAAIAPPPLPRSEHGRRRTQYGRSRAWLHPTKGWRGDGVKPRGTNKRRVGPPPPPALTWEQQRRAAARRAKWWL